MSFCLRVLWTIGLFYYCMMLPIAAQDVILPFGESPIPAAPDYSQLAHWAAHPDKRDAADKVPRPLRGEQSSYRDQVDVFFVHPTIFSGKVKDAYPWNADLNNKKLNQSVDNSTIKYQASAFNGAGKIYAPRYRQAHLRSFHAPHIEQGNLALALAYEDVKAAFLYYLNTYNKGRPFILAGHSQGSRHLKKLLQELFDGQPLADQLVAAYIVGWGVQEDTYQHLPFGNSPEQTGCVLTWRTYARGYESTWVKEKDVCINPLLWTMDTTYAPYTLNEGAILYAFNSPRKGLIDAQVHDGALWVGEPHYWLKKFLMRKDYHIADYNLYYTNVRNNAIRRVRAFIQ